LQGASSRFLTVFKGKRVQKKSMYFCAIAKQCGLAVFCGAVFLSNAAQATDVWLAGTDPVVRRTSYKDEQPTDYMQLFEDNAPWTNAAKNTKAFKTTTQFVVGATDEQLSKMFANLKKRKISFAMETLMLPVGDNGCGKGIEGYLDPNGLQSVIERIRRLGGELRYVAMDEPLWFGHTSNQPNACHSSIESIARNVAFRVSVIRKVFPEVAIGDIEPVDSPAQPNDWMDEISQWAEAYRKANGTPLLFFDADVTWSGSWKPQIKSLAERLHTAGISFGMIYDGDATDQSGVAWTTHAEERFTQVESDPSIRPQRAILQSWTLQPTHMLPETEPGTMTYLVNRYLSRGVVLTLERAHGRLFGHLADSSGDPVNGGQVALFAVDGATAAKKSMRTLSGKVPATASKAIVGLRINTECGCSGPAQVSVGALNYRDARANTALRSFLPTNATDTEFSAKAGEAISRNSQPFTVAAGTHFTFEVPMGATSVSIDSGYLALLFLDSNGKEVERTRLPFQPSTEDLGTVTTNSKGDFSLQLPADTTNSNPSYRATFSGGSGYRLTSTVLQ
jgi:hypothetical protein